MPDLPMKVKLADLKARKKAANFLIKKQEDIRAIVLVEAIKLDLYTGLEELIEYIEHIESLNESLQDAFDRVAR